MNRIPILILCAFLMASGKLNAQTPKELVVKGTKFERAGEHFEYTGISFFNALFNKDFNASQQERKGYLQKFHNHGINVLRVWCQWDNARGFVDAGKGQSLYKNDGNLDGVVLGRLTNLLEDAEAMDMVVLLVLFSRESWNEGIILEEGASELAVGELAKRLKPHRNLIFQIWNEHDYRTVDYLKIIKSIDPMRLVTNSPGYAGVLGSPQENLALDFLSPHTSRNDDRHWEIAPDEVRYLLTKYQKPVVDDEPARKGTPQFGGPKTPTHASDHIIHTYTIWKEGGYVIYHHDMFQTGYGTEPIPQNGIPLPGFSKYHDEVFEFLKNKERYLKQLGVRQ
jgi:hypothetical protein